MLMIRETLSNGIDRLRNITRGDLPEGPVPREGRLLTTAQINDALSLAHHAMSRRPGVGKDEYLLGQEALEHLAGHIVAVQTTAPGGVG